MKKGTKVRVVKLYDNEDYQLGDILTYERDYNYFIDVNGDEQILDPSEYEVIKEDLPRKVEALFYGTCWSEVELVAIYNDEYLCRFSDKFELFDQIREIHPSASQTKEMTIEEIQKELGYKIKVVE